MIEKQLFYDIVLGENALFITELYHLYEREDDTPQAKYFVTKDVKKFQSQIDVATAIVQDTQYFMQCNFDCSAKDAKKIARYIHFKLTRKVDLNEK